MVTTTFEQLYIIELASPYERLSIQFVPPEIENSRVADVSEIKIIGRNHPRHHYTGGNEQLPLKLDFLADNALRDNVYDKVRWLQSLCMNDGLNGMYRQVKLVFGKMWRDKVWVVKSVSPKFSNFDMNYGWLPLRASVDILLELDNNDDYTLSDARN